MPDWFVILLPKLTALLFVFAFGACVGSLVNVLVYRLPRGLDVVRPTSRCPSCGTKLTWRENIPILGWLLLRGRCRFCKSKISPEYPIVEFVVAALFAIVWGLWYAVPGNAEWLGVPWGSVAPEWAANGFARTWPAFVAMAVLIGCLTAATLIDARTFTIPLVLTWVPLLVGIAFHTGHAAVMGWRHGPLMEVTDGLWRFDDNTRWITTPGWMWTITTPAGWSGVGLALGGALGLGVSALLVRFGVLTQSFADYEAWEKAELERQQAEGRQAADGAPEHQPHPEQEGPPAESGRDAPHDPAGSPELWVAYPHARREMIRELAYLCPAVVLGLGLAKLLPTLFAGVTPPLWLLVLAGSLLGALVGGGVVWAVRIFGSLAFGKEAMGLGDVHLMAAVGAVCGWFDPVLAFFGAAFVGVAYAAVGLLALRRMPRAMPYGPFLAIATVLVVLGKPAIEWAAVHLLGLGGVMHLP
jgi:leader peptidase (prepilin peptidase)/N-methyltransferase